MKLITASIIAMSVATTALALDEQPPEPPTVTEPHDSADYTGPLILLGVLALVLMSQDRDSSTDQMMERPPVTPDCAFTDKIGPCE